MIVSHKHKFIFIKSRKTASTSLEVYLEPFCGEEDVITPVSTKYADPETNSHRPRNYSKFFPHTSAEQIHEYLGKEDWQDYFKFTVERNPWDKLVSMYWWRCEQGQLDNKVDFHEFCKVGFHDSDHVYTYPSDFPLYSIDGKVCVDYVIRFESLIDGFRDVCSMTGIPFDCVLPRAKGKARKEKRHYSTYYNDQSVQYVRERFMKEINFFGYSFDIH